jgi:plastocyanin
MQEKTKTSLSISRRGFIKLITATFGLGIAPRLLTSCASQNEDEYQVDIVLQQSEIHYSPATLTVPMGATVTWLNKSYYSQSVTCDPQQAENGGIANLPQGAQPWDSGTLYPGQRFSKKFDMPGTYIYFSLPKLSPNTVGTIMVQ